MKNLVAFFILISIVNNLIGQAPNWSVNPAGYSLDFTIIGSLNTQGQLSEDTDDMVAAFDENGTIRGVSNVTFNSNSNTYFVNLTVLGNISGDRISFKVYDATEDSVYEALNEAILFSPNAIIGSSSNPHVFYNSNNPLSLSLGATSINENNSINDIVGEFTTVVPLPTGMTFTYSLVSGMGDSDNSDFSVVGDQLEALISFNHEVKDSFSIRVESISSLGDTFQDIFAIYTIDVNEAPTSISLTNDSITENNAVGDTVALLSTTDEDLNETFSYTIEPTPFTDFADFTIVDGALRPFISFDYETKNQYTIDVTSTDSHGSSVTSTFNIHIKDDTSEVNVGVKDLTKNNWFSLYPNPSQGAFSLRREYIHDDALSIVVLNNLGQIVYQKESKNPVVKFELNHLKPGIYFINVSNETKSKTSRLVIDK